MLLIHHRKCRLSQRFLKGQKLAIADFFDLLRLALGKFGFGVLD